MFDAVCLARAGYFGGNPDTLLQTSVSIVQACFDHHAFESIYKSEYTALNKKKEG